MIQIPLAVVPNQSLSFQDSGVNYELQIRDNGDIMSLYIYIANQLILSGARAVASFPLIPYPYLQNGNFIFLTANEEMPYYTRFNVDQYLIFLSQNELDGIQNGTLIFTGS